MHSDVCSRIKSSTTPYWTTPLLTKVLDIANVIPAWFGAISAWLLRCPDELQALRPMERETKLKAEKSLYRFYFSENILNNSSGWRLKT